MEVEFKYLAMAVKRLYESIDKWNLLGNLIAYWLVLVEKFYYLKMQVKMLALKLIQG